MTIYEAEAYKKKYDRLISKIDTIKQSLTKYDLNSTHTNKYFWSANLSYLPMKTFDEKTTLLIEHLNQKRQRLVEYKNEIDNIKRTAESKRDNCVKEIERLGDSY